MKRASALGLGIGALGTLLAACGDDDSSSELAPAPPAEPAAPAEEPPPPAEEPPLVEEAAPVEEAPEASAASIGTAEIDATGLAAVDTDAGAIAVANGDGEYFAFGDTCTHQGCSLSTGTLRDVGYLPMSRQYVQRNDGRGRQRPGDARRGGLRHHG